MARLAVVLFNLGGPDSPDAIRPFLFNLFNDRAIIGLPGLFRGPLAWFLSRRRTPVATEIYEKLGGSSPLLNFTGEQASALDDRLAHLGDLRVFIAMRYWHPMSDETAAAVKAFDPDQVVLLPLYPQFSTTTTASSLDRWRQAAAAVGLTAPSHAICCYPEEQGWIRAVTELAGQGLEEAKAWGQPRLLFSAHGLPKKIVDGGDPYAWQVERTATAVAAALGLATPDWAICYQSRVGPLEWLGPSLDDELRRAAVDGVPVAVVPIAFVSEHSETLVELDMEYLSTAQDLGVPGYVRVPAVATHPAFMDGLARLVEAALSRGQVLTSGRSDGTVNCAGNLGRCPLRQSA
jgi:ferrochelatase